MARGEAGHGQGAPRDGVRAWQPTTEAPLRQPNGSYTRSFASGTRAIFDPKTGLGKIFWAEQQYM